MDPEGFPLPVRSQVTGNPERKPKGRTPVAGGKEMR